MKKALILAVAAVATLAGNAMAAGFAEGDFLRIVYNESKENAWDLGAAPTAGTSTVANVGISGTSSLDKLGYFSFNTADNTGWFSWNSNTFNAATGTDTLGAIGVMLNAPNVYSAHASNSTRVGDYSQLNSIGSGAYYDLLKSNLGGMFTGPGLEADLNTFATTPVTQYLFHFNYDLVNGVSLIGGNTAGLTVATSLQNGNIVANISPVQAAPVPIPGAVVLLGSGLAGLLGIRRKVS